jgi:hypothetical protein
VKCTWWRVSFKRSLIHVNDIRIVIFTWMRINLFPTFARCSLPRSVKWARWRRVWGYEWLVVKDFFSLYSEVWRHANGMAVWSEISHYQLCWHLTHDRLNDFMTSCLSLEANNSSVTQEILDSLRNPKVKFLSTQELATGSYPEPDESILHTSYFFMIHFNIITQYGPWTSVWPLTVIFSHQSLESITFLSHECHLY